VGPPQARPRRRDRRRTDGARVPGERQDNRASGHCFHPTNDARASNADSRVELAGVTLSRPGRSVLSRVFGETEPAVQFVQNGFDDGVQLVGDLRLGASFVGAPAGVADDDLEHAGDGDPL
jgi:hypothetical protein